MTLESFDIIIQFFQTAQKSSDPKGGGGEFKLQRFEIRGRQAFLMSISKGGEKRGATL